MKIILASASPRRKELLSQIGWEFSVQVSQVEEIITKIHPGEIVEELSELKARAIFQQTEGDVLVIGADTVVAHKGQILGKPIDTADAVRMLEGLRNDTHQVYTGVTLCMRHEGRETVRSFYESTEVNFYPMSREEIEWYVGTGEPMDKAGIPIWNTPPIDPATGEPEWKDKAGAYGIQGLAGRFVKQIRGDYNNVVGLPAARLYQEVKQLTREV